MDPAPSVTVIMPIRDEEAFIERSLGAVLTQDYPPDRMQILVADGGSRDRTREIVAALAQSHPQHQVEIIDNPEGIVATGLNAALERMSGEIVVRVDGHTIIEPDYVSACVQALTASGADNVGGRMDAVGETPLAEAIAVATSSPFGVGNSRFHYATGEHWVDSVYMGAWPREVFDRIGRFDPEMVRNQDDEFNYRLRAGGGRILLTDTIRSQYYNRSSLRALFRQYRQYGYWKVRVLQKHPRQMSARQFVPPALVLGLGVAALAAPVSRTARRFFAAIAGTYGAAALVASCVVARRSGMRHLPRLPVIFGALHIGYGYGFITGLVSFRKRWTDEARPGTGPRS